jgi:hypothetical protein
MTCAPSTPGCLARPLNDTIRNENSGSRFAAYFQAKEHNACRHCEADLDEKPKARLEPRTTARKSIAEKYLRLSLFVVNIYSHNRPATNRLPIGCVEHFQRTNPDEPMLQIYALATINSEP